MKKKTLVETLAAKTGLTRPQAARVLAATLATLEECLASGESINLKGYCTLQLGVSPPRKATGLAKASDAAPKPSLRMRCRLSKCSRDRLFEQPEVAKLVEDVSRRAAEKAKRSPGAATQSSRVETAQAMTARAMQADSSPNAPTLIVPNPALSGDAAEAAPAAPAAVAPDAPSPKDAQARAVARVMAKDIVLYHGDLVKEVEKGADMETVLGEVLEQARATLAQRLGDSVAGHDYVGEALRALI